MKKPEVVIDKIKRLTKTKGFIYAFCMILCEDFRVNLEKIHEMNQSERLTIKEASLLIGFLIQDSINFDKPDSWNEVIEIKRKVYSLMDELHNTFNTEFADKAAELFKKDSQKIEVNEILGQGTMLVEPIFYSSSGVYDVQYLDLLEKKYKYDKKWVIDNKKFSIEQAKTIVLTIREFLVEKSRKVFVFNLKEALPELISHMGDQPTDVKEEVIRLLPMAELYQYYPLLLQDATELPIPGKRGITEDMWNSFYNGLIDLFVISSEQISQLDGVDHFLDNFSVTAKRGMNSDIRSVGDYNIVNAKPIIALNKNRYFVPIPFLLCEAVYENPFYWMREDSQYEDQLFKNRGIVGEEIAFDFLSKVFKSESIFCSVKISLLEKPGSTVRTKDITDIDVLCILGSKALCVQVKSKKLTELSRTGNDNKLREDFKAAVQDAYRQGLVARKMIFDHKAQFTDRLGNKINLDENIDEVYVMCITTENYPALAHQVHVLLDKKREDPFPLVLTIFDLELIVHYLKDPYDFMYYVRQRILLMDYFYADEEMVFLGYHLDRKLFKLENKATVVIDRGFGQLIDRNYYPYRVGVAISDEGDTIKTKTTNKRFTQLCDELKQLSDPRITDIIFYLLDWSGEAQKNLTECIIKTKTDTLEDDKLHDFSIEREGNDLPRLGVTFFSHNSDNISELSNKLLGFCNVRKYQSKAAIWIGLGSLKNSSSMVDIVTFNDNPWEYNENLEKLSEYIFHPTRS